MTRILRAGTVMQLATATFICMVAHSTGESGPSRILSRKSLIKLGGLCALYLLGDRWWNSRIVEAQAAIGLPGASCVLTPEQTEGPYYIAREKIRKNIVEHRPGIPLKLQFSVVDSATCRPIKGAAVDIWHCDAGGIYAGFEAASTGGAPGGSGGPTDTHTFLRGIQLTNSKGRSDFQTIYPGWYRGRTVHIHVKVHLAGASSTVVHTGQLYFPENITAAVFRATPYRARAAARDTFNSSDPIFGSGGRQSMLAIKSDGHGGYVGAITLGVKRS